MPAPDAMAESEAAAVEGEAAPDAPALLEVGDLRLRQCRHGVMLYSLNDKYIGQSLEHYGEYCELEIALYRRIVGPGQVVVDAGAHIGALTLFLAKAVGPRGMVAAFEPQRVMFQMLCANVALNGLRHVDTRHMALGAARGRLQVPPRDYGQTFNFGGVRLRDDGPGEPVPVMPLDAMGLKRCDLLKIDVEGMERDVVLGARRTIAAHRPVIYAENNLHDKSPALIQTLIDLGYRLYWHLPRVFNPDNYRGNPEDVFGRALLNVNMLCLPADDSRQVGLPEVRGPDDWWRREE